MLRAPAKGSDAVAEVEFERAAGLQALGEQGGSAGLGRRRGDQLVEPVGVGADRVRGELPAITVPAITLEGDANGAPHPDPGAYAAKFTGKYAHRTISGGVGHNLPQEALQALAEAVVDVDNY